MMTFVERLKDVERRVERIEHEIDLDNLQDSINGVMQLVENWASRLTDAMTNPTINWPEIHRVVDTMHEFGRRKTEK